VTEEFFVKLAGIRKVRTPGGSAYFDLPIGAPITADAILRAKKKHASAKEGSASSSGGSGGVGTLGTKYDPQTGKMKPGSVKTTQTPSGPVPDKAADKSGSMLPTPVSGTNKKLMQANGAAVVQPKPKAKVENSSLSGPKKFKIGDKEFNVPEGSKLFRSKTKDDRAFLIDPEGKGHVFMSKGEVKFPEVYMEALVEKLNGDLTDTDYVPSVFDSEDSKKDAPEVSSSLADMPAGQVLRDSELTPQFVKQEDGTWKHADLDIDITSDKLQPLVDSGELQATSPEQDDELQDVGVPKEIDFGKFETKEEFDAEISQYEAGDQLVLDKGEEVDPDILTKTEEGNWTSATGAPVHPAVMFALKDKLSGISPEGQKGDQEKITPASVEADDVPDFIPDPEDTKPLNAKSKTAEAPVAAEKTDTPATTPKSAPKSSETPSKAAEAPFVDPFPFVDLDGARWKSEQSFTEEGGNAAELEKAPRSKEEYLASKPTSFSTEDWMSQAPQPKAAPEKPKVTKIKIGDLKKGDEVGGGTILEIGTDPKNKKKVAVKYKSNKNGTVKYGSWWKNSDIQIYPADAPVEGETDFKGIPNAKKFDGDLTSLKKGEFVFIKTSDEFNSFEKVNGSWFRRDGDPWNPDSALPLNVSDETLSIYLGNKAYVTDSLGNSAIQAKNAKLSKEKLEKLKVDGLSDGELDDLEAGSVIAVDHDPNKSPKNFVKTNNGQWIDHNGYFHNTSGITKGKKEVLEGEDADNFKAGISDALGKDAWLKAEPMSAEEEIDNSIQQSIAETADLAPAEPKGVKNFLTTGEKTPPSVPKDWKLFFPQSVVDVPVGDKIIIIGQKDGSSLKFERTKTGWREGDTDYEWSTEDLLYNAPGSQFDYWTNDGAPDDFVNEDGIADGKSIKEGTELDVSSVEEVTQLPSNMSLDVGGKKFAPSDNGLVDTATGAPITQADLKGKKVVVDSVIPVGDNPVPFTVPATGEVVQPGTPITTDVEFASMPLGAQVHMGTDDVKGVIFTKSSWFNYSAPGFDILVPQDDLVMNLHDGIPATYIGMGPIPGEEILADWEKELLEVPYGSLGKFEKAEIVEALNSLESHSGFQISYGLKAVPDNKIAKNQAVLKELAQKEFPELKPKPAFVAYLKKYGSIQEAKAVKIGQTKVYKIGAEAPKKTGVQGWDGGDFTAEDIQDAINILESFQGKNFKSELNKKGNALGKLDPNPIVGFNKDKSVTKQKFIDHLKEVLGDDDPVADIEDKADQAVVDNLASIADGIDAPTPEASESKLSKMKLPSIAEMADNIVMPDSTIAPDKNVFGKAIYKSIASGETIPAMSNAFDYYPLGTVIGSESGNTSFKKLSGGTWESSNGTIYDQSDIKALLDGQTFSSAWQVKSIPDVWGLEKSDLDAISINKPEKNEVLDVDAGDPADDKIEDVVFDDSSTKVGDKLTPAILATAPAGTKLINPELDTEEKQEKYSFTMLENGMWKANASGAEYSGEDVWVHYAANLEVGEVPNTTPDSVPETFEIVLNKATVHDIETAPLGKTLWDSQTPQGAFVKNFDSSWTVMYGDKNYNMTTASILDANIPLYHEKPEKVNSESLEGLPDGTALKVLKKNNSTHLVKHPDSWYVHNDSGEKMYPIDSPSVKNLADEGLYMYKSGTDELSAPSATPEETNKVSAGKYTTTGKVFMYVNEDGSGVYVDKSGKPKKLTPNAVQKNYDGGMNKFLGDSEAAPSLNESVLTKPAPKKAKKAEGIPDGEYFIGLPASGKATKIVVKDGTYTQFKPLTGKGVKVGGEINNSWLNDAPDGAQYAFSKYDYSLGKTISKTFTKTHGKWLNDETAEEANDTDEKYWANNTITHLGYGDPSPAQKKSLETKFAQGALLDQYATSIVPEGYSGSLLFLGGTTTGQQLADILKNTSDPVKDWKATTLKLVGLTIDNNTAVRFLKDQGVDLSDYDSKMQMGKYFHKYAQDITDGIDVEEHESNAAELFTFDGIGQAEMPLFVAANPITYDFSAKEATDWVNTASSFFGDGNIIGQHLASKGDKIQWGQHLAQGNFKEMYDLEVSGASQKGIPHVAGYLHPGYVGNKDTNKITWGAAVKGEVPAGGEVEGSWTTLNTQKWSAPELDNYLIKAQMQNPQHLSASEKRSWVQWHKNGNKSFVDSLSAKAAWRAQQGDTELSDPPVWTEGIVPAKSYDYLFDDAKYPGTQAWGDAGYQVAHDWMGDNKKNEDFLNFWKTTGASHVGYSSYVNENPYDVIGPYDKLNLVSAYFDEKEAEYQAELLKPVYSMVKKLAGGQNTTWLLRDQFERKAVFKPIAHNKGSEALFRVEVENAGNNLGLAAGFHVPESSIGQVGEDTGQIQKFIENQGDFSGIDLTTLTDTQLAQVAGHQVLDYFLQNDDTHHRNLMLDKDGNVVGIDKGRAFLAYGTYEGLAPDPKNSHMSYNMLSSDNLVYAVMIDRMRKGDFTPEQAREAYLGAMKAARRINRMSDEQVSELVREGVKNRPANKWGYKDYHYFAGKDVLDKVPNNSDELVERVLEYKADIPEKVQAMYDAVFEAAGWDKPEMPKEAIPGHTSGWQEESTVEKALATKVFGNSALHSSGSIVGGSSLVWTETDTSDKEVVKGSLKIGKFLGKQLGQTLQSLTQGSSKKVTVSTDSNASSFPDTKALKSAISAAGKNLTKNINLSPDNKNFDPAVWAAFDENAKKVDSDLEFYTPELLDSSEDVKFPSGNIVPANYVSQYHMALLHYKGQIEKVNKAKENDTPTNKADFTQYTVTPLNGKFVTYTNPKKGEQYKQLNNEKFVYVSTKGGLKTSIVNSLPDDAKALKGGWTAEGVSVDEPVSPVKVKLVASHVASGELSQSGVFKQDGGKTTKAQTGSQFEMTLPTGEVIAFRNYDYTNAFESQNNKLFFQTAGDDHQASLARIEEYLATLDVDMSGAEDPEVLYWRSMFHRVVASGAGGSKISAAREKVMKKAKEGAQKLGKSNYGVGIHDTGEAIAMAFPEEELSFYRNLANETWGTDHVAKFLSEDRHLPKYQHMNLNDGSLNTGHAYWERIDVELEELQKQGTLLAVAAKGKDDAILRYITSGGLLSTEVRSRMAPHTGASQSEDQNRGGADYVFSRVTKGNNALTSMGNLNKGKHTVFLSPEVLLHNDTYGYESDNFGATDAMQNSNYDPKKLLNMTDSTNEVMIKDTLSILDYIELMVFDKAEKRNEAIQRLKALGWEKIRGLPVEDRLVMRQNLEQAITKVKASWK